MKLDWSSFFLISYLYLFFCEWSLHAHCSFFFFFVLICMLHILIAYITNYYYLFHDYEEANTSYKVSHLNSHKNLFKVNSSIFLFYRWEKWGWRNLVSCPGLYIEDPGSRVWLLPLDTATSLCSQFCKIFFLVLTCQLWYYIEIISLQVHLSFPLYCKLLVVGIISLKPLHLTWSLDIIYIP